MSLGLSTTVRNNRLQQLLNAIDLGGAAATLSIYDSTRPATGASIGGSTLLAALTLPYPCAMSPTGGVATLGTIPDGTGAATGTATWGRITDSNGTFVADLSITVTGGGGDIQTTSTNITTGAPVVITSIAFTEGNA